MEPKRGKAGKGKNDKEVSEEVGKQEEERNVKRRQAKKKLDY